MKRHILIIAIFSLAVSLYSNITVVSVTGHVKYEETNGNWKTVTVNSRLSLESIINTGINSRLELKTSNDEMITIKAMKKGSIEDLIEATTSSFSGIQLQSSLTKSDANADDIQERTNIGTASTRASDATEDLEWIED